MIKELSITTIKKELMDALLNNMDILKYLQIEKHLDRGIKMSNIYNTLIFDYDESGAGNDYITVEVAEHEIDSYYNQAIKTYVVHIKIGLEKEKYLDDVANIISGIISKLYPNRKNYINMPFYKKAYYSGAFGNNREYDKLNRIISFEINNQMM